MIDGATRGRSARAAVVIAFIAATSLALMRGGGQARRFPSPRLAACRRLGGLEATARLRWFPFEHQFDGLSSQYRPCVRRYPGGLTKPPTPASRATPPPQQKPSPGTP